MTPKNQYDKISAANPEEAVAPNKEVITDMTGATDRLRLYIVGFLRKMNGQANHYP